MCVDIRVKQFFFFCPMLTTLLFSLQIFEKFSNTKFHENPSSSSRVVPCGRTDVRPDITKLIVAFRNFANAPQKKSPNILKQWSTDSRSSLKSFVLLQQEFKSPILNKNEILALPPAMSSDISHFLPPSLRRHYRYSITTIFRRTVLPFLCSTQFYI